MNRPMIMSRVTFRRPAESASTAVAAVLLAAVAASFAPATIDVFVTAGEVADELVDSLTPTVRGEVLGATGAGGSPGGGVIRFDRVIRSVAREAPPAAVGAASGRPELIHVLLLLVAANVLAFGPRPPRSRRRPLRGYGRLTGSPAARG